MDFCPYKGLQPYTENDRKYFFGREREESVIASNLYSAPLTILYGASGVGKSSVLLAAVVPRLRKDDQVVPVVFRTWQQSTYQVSLKTEVLKALNQRLEQVPQIDTTLPLDDFLLECDRVLPFRGRILFIFDQFEEYFLRPGDPSSSESFDAEFARAVNRREIPVNFLLSMRDDGLSKLDRFSGRIPNLMSNLLRVRHLKLAEAHRAILKPLEVYNTEVPANQQMTIEQPLVEAVADRARPDVRTQPGAMSSDGHENVVETPVLQILLTRLWKAEKEVSSNVLRFETFEKLGGAEHIVLSYLDDVLDSLSEREREIAAVVFPFLLTPEKTKTSQVPRSLALWTKNDPAEVEGLMARLSAREDKILRRIEISGQPARFEIFHDVLGAPIYEWCEKFAHERAVEEAAKLSRETAEALAKEAERHLRIEQAEALAKKESERAEAEGLRAEEQRKRAETEARATVRMRRFTYALAVVCVLAVLTAGYASYLRGQARRAEQEAVRQYRYAQDQQQLALREKVRANAAANDAMMERARAIENAEEAKKQSLVAKEQADLAKRETERANKEARIAEEAKAAALGDRDLVVQQARANELYMEGTNSFLNGRYEEGINRLRQTLVLYEKFNNPKALARTLATIGQANNTVGRRDEAIVYYQQAAKIYRQQQFPAGEANTLKALGDIYVSMGDTMKAEDSLQSALRIYEQNYDVVGQANALNGLSNLYQGKRDYERALLYLDRALKLNNDIENLNGTADTLLNMAALYETRDDQKALGLLNQSAALYEKLKNRLGLAHALNKAGAIYERLGDKDKARELYQKANEALLTGNPKP